MGNPVNVKNTEKAVQAILCHFAPEISLGRKLCSERVDRPALTLPLASERPCRGILSHVVTHAFIANQFMSWCRSFIKIPVLNASLSETVKCRISETNGWVW